MDNVENLGEMTIGELTASYNIMRDELSKAQVENIRKYRLTEHMEDHEFEQELMATKPRVKQASPALHAEGNTPTLEELQKEYLKAKIAYYKARLQALSN